MSCLNERWTKMQTTTEKQKTEEYSIIKLPKKVQNKAPVGTWELPFWKLLGCVAESGNKGKHCLPKTSC